MPASAWFVATDADAAGDKFAAGWPESAKRVRPFGGCKDWGELHESGRSRIRYHWLPLLGWKPPSWEDLASQRWRPTTEGAEPPDEPDVTPERAAWLLEFNALIGRPNPPELGEVGQDRLSTQESR
jgi:hypothetical protein